LADDTLLKIQDGCWLTGSSNNFAAVTDRHVVPKMIRCFQLCTEDLYLQQPWPTSIQDGGQKTINNINVVPPIP